MQKFEFLRQPLLGELAMSRKKKEERREKNAIYSGHLRLCQQPRAAHALRSDQNQINTYTYHSFSKARFLNTAHQQRKYINMLYCYQLQFISIVQLL